MKSIKTFVAVIALAASFGTFAAQTVTATASTIDGAEVRYVRGRDFVCGLRGYRAGGGSCRTLQPDAGGFL